MTGAAVKDVSRTARLCPGPSDRASPSRVRFRDGSVAGKDAFRS